MMVAAVDVFGNHGLGGLLKEGSHEKSPKCLGGNLGDFGEFCKGLRPSKIFQTAFFDVSIFIVSKLASTHLPLPSPSLSIPACLGVRLRKRRPSGRPRPG